MILRTTLAVCASAAFGSAQATITAAALTPITVSANSPSGSGTQSLPVGPLPVSVSLATGSGSVTDAAITADVAAAATFAEFRCEILAFADSNPASTAAVGGCEILVSLQAPQLIPVALEVAVVDYSSIGTPRPQIDIDVGNDGSIEYVNGVLAQGGGAVLAVGPQPLELRIVLAAAATSAQVAWSSLEVIARAAGGVATVPTATACSIGGVTGNYGDLVAEPSFVANGIHIHAPAPFWAQQPLLVLGLSSAPVLLPINVGLPCLLVPSLDVTIPVPPGGLTLVVPPVLRPLRFYAQNTWVEGAALVVSDGLRIDAL